MRIPSGVAIRVYGTCLVVASLLTGCSPDTTTSQVPIAPPATVPPAPGPEPIAAVPMPNEPTPSAEESVAASAPAPAQANAPAAMGPLRSVTERYSLIENSHFVEWLETDPLPRHWTLGATLAPDKIPSSIRAVEIPATSFSHPLEQTWKDNDTAQRITDAFGQTVAGLEPGTEYELRVVAHNQSKNTVIVSAFEVNEFNPDNPASGKPGERLSLAVVTIPPGKSVTEFTGTFRTASEGTVRLAARIQQEKPKFPGTVLWYSWVLHPVEGKQSNLVPNGSFAVWPEGEEVPRLWLNAPPSDLNFGIEKLEGPEYVCGRALELTWQKPQTVHYALCLGANLMNLNANTEYAVELIVNNPSKNTYRLSAWEMTGGENLASIRMGDRLSYAVLQIGPESQGTYKAEGSFTTKKKGSVRLTLSCEETEENKDFPADLIMEEWRVYEKSDAPRESTEQNP